MNNTKNRQNVKNAAIVAAGVLGGVAAYSMGVRTGAKYDSLAKDLIAHQLIVIRLRAENPELVDTAVNETISQLNGIINAAN